MVSRQKTPPPMRSTTRAVDECAAELSRVEVLVAAVAAQLGDPELELTTTMRLGILQRELQAYLRGIKYGLGAAPSLSDLPHVEQPVARA